MHCLCTASWFYLSIYIIIYILYIHLIFYFIAAADLVSKNEEILLAEATSILENRIKKLNESG